MARQPNGLTTALQPMRITGIQGYAAGFRIMNARLGTFYDGVVQTRRGLAAALRSRAAVFAAVATAVAVFNVIGPVAVLSVARKPVDFFAFNPWLRRLPDYLLSSEPLSGKLPYLSHLTVAWFSAAGPGDGVEWAFVIDAPTIVRIVFMSAVFGAYFALWSYQRRVEACETTPSAARPAGVLGAMTTVFGLTTGPCTLAGCGAPVLPVLGLAFTGLPPGALAAFATVSRISIALVLVLMTAAVFWFAWRAGAPTSAQSALQAVPSERAGGFRPRPARPIADRR
jgi:hypothetical protein